MSRPINFFKMMFCTTGYEKLEIVKVNDTNLTKMNAWRFPASGNSHW